MKLLFEGHDYRYAVEQSLLAFFPEERPVYEGEDPNTARVELSVNGGTASAVTELSWTERPPGVRHRRAFLRRRMNMRRSV